MLFRGHKIRKLKMQFSAAWTLKPAQSVPADMAGTINDMASSCIISGEQPAAVRAKWSIFIPDPINLVSLVIFHGVINSNDQDNHFLIR